jgi:hypothetical protein
MCYNFIKLWHISQNDKLHEIVTYYLKIKLKKKLRCITLLFRHDVIISFIMWIIYIPLNKTYELKWRGRILWNLILVQHQYNNCTTTLHMRVGSSMWNPPSCERLLYSCYIDIVNLTFFRFYSFELSLL